MKSLLTLLREEDLLIHQFNEMIVAIEGTVQNIEYVQTLRDCPSKTIDLARYHQTAVRDAAKAAELAGDIVDKRTEITETFSAERITNYLQLRDTIVAASKEIENIKLKG